jgi:hypothetical protein
LIIKLWKTDDPKAPKCSFCNEKAILQRCKDKTNCCLGHLMGTKDIKRIEWKNVNDYDNQIAGDRK